MEIPLPLAGKLPAHSGLDLVGARSQLNAAPVAHSADVSQRQAILRGSIVQRHVGRFSEAVGRPADWKAEISALKTAGHLQSQSASDFPSIRYLNNAIIKRLWNAHISERPKPDHHTNSN